MGFAGELCHHDQTNSIVQIQIIYCIPCAQRAPQLQTRQSLLCDCSVESITTPMLP